jgi:hypothetical protein
MSTNDMEELKAGNKRTYVTIADLKDNVANSEDLSDWLLDGWEIVSVRRVYSDAEQAIVILVTVESSTNPVGVPKFRSGSERRDREGLPH